MANVVDLRGRQVLPAPDAVLADPSGKRARLLARGGRAAAVLFLLWLLGLALAGLGILPTGDVPFGRTLAVGQGPAPLKALPRASQPSASDLIPAKPLSSATATRHPAGASASRSTASSRSVARSHRHHPGSSSSSTAPATGGAVITPTSAVGQGKAGAPGQVNQQTTPGHTKTSSPGKSGTAPGHSGTSTTSSTAPGNSGSTHGNGRGHNNTY